MSETGIDVAIKTTEHYYSMSEMFAELTMARYVMAGVDSDSMAATQYYDTMIGRSDACAESIRGLAGLLYRLGNHSAGTILSLVAHLAQLGIADRLLPPIEDWVQKNALQPGIVYSWNGGRNSECEYDPVDVLNAVLWCSSSERMVALRTMKYDAFLKTPYWRALRAVIIDRDKGSCRNCTATTDLHVHHRTYEHRGFEFQHADDLTTLCSGCHAKFHEKNPRPE